MRRRLSTTDGVSGDKRPSSVKGGAVASTCRPSEAASEKETLASVDDASTPDGAELGDESEQANASPAIAQSQRASVIAQAVDPVRSRASGIPVRHVPSIGV